MKSTDVSNQLVPRGENTTKSLRILSLMTFAFVLGVGVSVLGGAILTTEPALWPETVQARTAAHELAIEREQDAIGRFLASNQAFTASSRGAELDALGRYLAVNQPAVVPATVRDSDIGPDALGRYLVANKAVSALPSGGELDAIGRYLAANQLAEAPAASGVKSVELDALGRFLAASKAMTAESAGPELDAIGRFLATNHINKQ